LRQQAGAFDHRKTLGRIRRIQGRSSALAARSKPCRPCFRSVALCGDEAQHRFIHRHEVNAKARVVPFSRPLGPYRTPSPWPADPDFMFSLARGLFFLSPVIQSFRPRPRSPIRGLTSAEGGGRQRHCPFRRAAGFVCLYTSSGWGLRRREGSSFFLTQSIVLARACHIMSTLPRRPLGGEWHKAVLESSPIGKNAETGEGVFDAVLEENEVLYLANRPRRR